MSTVLNTSNMLWAVGVLQPTSPTTLLSFITEIWPEAGQMPSEAQVEKFLRIQIKKRHVIQVHHDEERFYSLTTGGNNFLGPKLRRIRDRTRMFLLRDARRNRIRLSREEENGDLTGASPVVDTSKEIKERAANKTVYLGRRKIDGQDSHSYWPLVSGQLSTETGTSLSSRDLFFPLLSFSDINQLRRASGVDAQLKDFGFKSIGASLGVSPGLVSQIAFRTYRHYRSFEIAKRGGGVRLIESPRVFLKVIQWYLVDYLLPVLPVHEAVYSYRFGRSIIDNAFVHTGQEYVANIDIVDFFGSVSQAAVRDHLIINRFSKESAQAISLLCTNQNRLPQGAPTSPIISNSILYDFDNEIANVCESYGLHFSRYADDISISGKDRENIIFVISVCSKLLNEQFGLQLNEKKTRIANRGGQQKVTGVVVNDEPAPPRAYRRRIRAMFHQADRNPERFLDQVSSMRGHLNYIESFPKFKGKEFCKNYREVIGKLEGFRA